VIAIDPYLLVRAGAIYLASVLTGAAWLWRRPQRRSATGALLGAIWNVPAVLLLNVLAVRFGLWRFDAHGGLLLGVPVDLLLSWSVLWGAVPALAFPSLPLTAITALALAVDLVLMPAASPVVRLGPLWLVGEAACLALAFVPGQLLARWTMRGERLPERAVLQMLAFSSLMVFLLPAIAIEGSGSAWLNPLTMPRWRLSLALQALALPALLGLTAVQEFVTRGGGTPVPFDPPRRLVTTGVYAYVANPMQLSAVMLLIVIGIVVRNAWVAAAGVMAHIYSLGLAGWDEDEDLRQRFGGDWIAYRRAVRRWIPRLRPWSRPDQRPARLFVAESCGMCSEVAQWFARRNIRGLVVVAAETHPSRALRRITYEPADGSRAASGVEAIARALEHIHLGWALVAFALRLPIVGPLAQLVADASGAEPRSIPVEPSAAPLRTPSRGA
jgi:protein-S-isoprenylcysteine O-methyltransferase Ste14